MTIAPIGLFDGNYHLNGATLNSTGQIRTQVVSGDNWVASAFNTNTLSYTNFITLTAGNPATCDLSTAVTIGGLPITTGGITQIDGDSGSATGSTVTFDASTNAGGSISFTGSSSTISLNTTDSNHNTFIGLNAGVPSSNINTFANTCIGQLSGNSLNGTALNPAELNVAYGYNSLFTLQTGQGNTAISYGSLQFLTSGSFNTAIGISSGDNYTTSESSNILLGNAGVVLDNNTIRIGTQGSGNAQQNKCYIAGITGVTTSNSNFVTIDTTTGQLGAVASAGGGTTATVQTLDASVTTLATIATSSNSVTTVNGYIAAAKSDYSNSCGGRINATFQNNAGTLTLVGSVVADINTTSSATFTASTSGTDIIITVTGIAATVYNWKITYTTVVN